MIASSFLLSSDSSFATRHFRTYSGTGIAVPFNVSVESVVSVVSFPALSCRVPSTLDAAYRVQRSYMLAATLTCAKPRITNRYDHLCASQRHLDSLAKLADMHRKGVPVDA